MADILILAIAIASAVSLLIVSPCAAQRKLLRTLRAYGETEALPIGVHGEDHLTTSPPPFDWIVRWRQSLDDGVYNVPGSLIRASNASEARYVGDRPGMQIHWQKTRHLWFQGDYGIFYAGRFLKQTQPGRNLNYWCLWTGYKF